MGELRATVALVVAGAVLTVSGCSDDAPLGEPEPIEVEPSEDAPTEEPSESEPAAEEPPAMPAAARKRSYGGAAEFVRHWVDLFNHLQSTGDSDPMMRVSDRRCVSCADAERVAAEIYDAGGSIESDGWIVREVGADGITPLSGPTLSARIRQTPEVLRQKNPDKVERIPANTFNVVFDLRREGDSWVMREVEVL